MGHNADVAGAIILSTTSASIVLYDVMNQWPNPIVGAMIILLWVFGLLLTVAG